MYIKQNEYFTVKEDTAGAIDITFSLREKSISNIARLYDDEVPCSYNESDRYISEIIFYYLIWKKFGALSEKSLQRIKKITGTVLSLDPCLFSLNPEEYADFVQCAKELYSANIPIFTDETIEQYNINLEAVVAFHDRFSFLLFDGLFPLYLEQVDSLTEIFRYWNPVGLLTANFRFVDSTYPHSILTDVFRFGRSRLTVDGHFPLKNLLSQFPT